jgi:hypothetical protein
MLGSSGQFGGAFGGPWGVPLGPGPLGSFSG